MKLFALALLSTTWGFAQPQVSTEQRENQFLIDAKKAIKLDPGEINALVMDFTFGLICANKATTESIVWTGFVLFHAINPEHPKDLQPVLVSAAHGFEKCLASGGVARIRFRRRDEANSMHWDLVDQEIGIADAIGPLWIKHQTADVAVLPIDVPRGMIRFMLPATILADKMTLKTNYYLAQDVYVLGYPFGQLGLSGFPILRPATIASRVVDDKSIFALSFQIYPGDSGGPVYAIERTQDGIRVVIVGLMYQADTMRAAAPKDGPFIGLVGIGYVVPSWEIGETINLLASKKHRR